MDGMGQQPGGIPPSQPAPTVQPQNQPTTSMPTQPQPQPAGIPKAKKPKHYLIVIAIILIGILAWAAIASHGSAKMPTNQTSTTTSIGLSTISYQNSSGNSSCPCLSRLQMENLLNESPIARINSSYNITYLSNLTEIMYQQRLDNATVPANVEDDLQRAWIATYNDTIYSSTNSSEELNETFREEILQSADPDGFYNYTLAEETNRTSAIFKIVPGGTVNGLQYQYANLTIFGVTGIAIIGHKNNLVVVALVETLNTGVASPQQMANAISAAV